MLRTEWHLPTVLTTPKPPLIGGYRRSMCGRSKPRLARRQCVSARHNSTRKCDAANGPNSWRSSSMTHRISGTPVISTPHAGNAESPASATLPGKEMGLGRQRRQPATLQRVHHLALSEWHGSPNPPFVMLRCVFRRNEFQRDAHVAPL
jgi:hypothetical protein